MITRFDDEITLSAEEQSMLDGMRLFLSDKRDDFREAFYKAIAEGYCDRCGKVCEHQCYCSRDD